MQIKVVLPGTEDWTKAVQLVREKYRQSFAAEVDPHPSYFFACLAPATSADEKSRVIACAGITGCDTRTRFFSEQYLDGPVEQLIARREGRPVPRSGIIEVGALASSGRQAGTELVRSIPILAWCGGKKYLLCTSTRQLRLLFDKVGLIFKPLQDASAGRLDETARARWGTYYDQQPQTGYICLAQLSSLFAHNTGRYLFPNPTINLLQRAPEEEPEHEAA